MQACQRLTGARYAVTLQVYSFPLDNASVPLAFRLAAIFHQIRMEKNNVTFKQVLAFKISKIKKLSRFELIQEKRKNF